MSTPILRDFDRFVLGLLGKIAKAFGDLAAFLLNHCNQVLGLYATSLVCLRVSRKFRNMRNVIGAQFLRNAQRMY